MNKNGFTLIEVILAIALIGLFVIAFLPAITFGYTNLVYSNKYTIDTFSTQKEVERAIEEKRKENPVDQKLSKKIFGKTVTAHHLKFPIIKKLSDGTTVGSKHGEINVFIPTKVITYDIPELKHDPVLIVKKGNNKENPQPKLIDLMNKNFNFFVNEVEVKDTKKLLVNVYRLYLSREMNSSETPSTDVKDYAIIKEWNEARELVSYERSEDFNFIPNIKDKYNELTFSEFNISDEELVQRFGNRFIRYSITPYSTIGKMGEEKLSNPIYLKAPAIKVLDAAFLVDLRPDLTEKDIYKVIVRFDTALLQNPIDIDKMNFNPILGQIANALVSPIDNKTLIVEFKDKITNEKMNNQHVIQNRLNLGSVQSATSGVVNIDNGEENNFVIDKKIVTFNSTSKYHIKTPNKNPLWIDVSGSGTANGSPIIIYHLLSGENQNWSFKNIANSPYSTISAFHDSSRWLKANDINQQVTRNDTASNAISSDTSIHWIIEKKVDSFIIRPRNNPNLTLGTLNYDNLKEVLIQSQVKNWNLILSNP